MGMGVLKTISKMNKLFLVCLAFALAAVAAGQPNSQPLFKDQCEANYYMLNRLKGLKDLVPKGEDSCGDALIGCIADLAGTIASCAISVVQWELVVACVATAIGAANDCFPCVCEAVEWTCGCDVC